MNIYRMIKTFFTIAALVTLLTACGTVAVSNQQLDEARERLNAAQQNPQITSLAGEELNQAAEALRVAEQALTAQAEQPTVDHLAYLTVQRVIIAEATASSRAAQAITAGAAAERERLRLALRTSEVERAGQALAKARESNEAQADKQARTDAQVSELQEQLKLLNARPTERGMVVTLSDVLFDTGQSTLRMEGSHNLAKLADFLQRYPDTQASIEGHTDSVGSAVANYALSQRRATAVLNALQQRGVSAAKLTTRAFGADAPVASNETTAGRQLNRRVEIVFSRLTNTMSSK